MSDPKEYLKHFSEKVSQEIVDYATNVVFLKNRYIFTEKLGNQKIGFCTHCKKRIIPGEVVLKHNEVTVCPHCKSTCIVKSSGKGRKSLYHKAYFVFYEKSVLDPNVIVARGIESYMDFGGDYRDVQIMFSVEAWYVFDTKNGSIMMKNMSWWNERYYHTELRLQIKKTVHCAYNSMTKASWWFGYSRDSIKQAVKDTPFSWSGWEKYNHEDMTKFFDLYTKYPCIEYITKLGFTDIMETKLTGGQTYNSIYWRGKNLFKVLKISKQQLNEIKANNIDVNCWFLNILKFNKNENWGLSLTEVAKVAKTYDYQQTFDNLQEMLKYGTMRRILGYMDKQFEKYRKSYYGASQVLSTWRDYLGDCKKLNLDLRDERVLFPKNVHEAHQNTIKQIKYIADQELKSKILKRVEELQKLCFESSGILIRPAASPEELVNEGKALSHCVGGYSERYANGSTNILFIRRTSKPDKPYYTIELSKKLEVIQVRGLKNCKPDEDVEKFLKAFKDKKLTEKKKQAKIKVPA